LAEAAVEGAREAGHRAELVHVDDHVRHFLRDCRRCRDASGRCTIEDGFEALLRERVLPAEAILFATPLYWYGISGQLKTFLDRLFCYIAASEPESEMFVSGLLGKRLALLISSEETYPGAALGVIHEIQEYARYTHSPFVGVVNGIGNKRGDVRLDPTRPLERARELGLRLEELRSTDYRLDVERPGSTWGLA
jgi:multimeric flavodoxin WrbA